MGDEAWTIIAGESLRTVITGEWPLIELGIRVFKHLVLACGQPIFSQPRKTPSSSSSSSLADDPPAQNTMDLLDAIEAQLEAAGDANLVDELYAALSREGGIETQSPLLRAVKWLQRQHFKSSGELRQGKDHSN